MDFRTCPACKASVLEDDAAECPFCGASMTTGKPSGKAQPSAAAKSPPASKAAPKPAAPAGAGAAKKPSAKPPAPLEDDTSDPFDVDTSAARGAIPVQPKPSKGKMLRIVCPMCEKAGFISPKELGKEVKCANPNCLMPVFVARSNEEKEPEPEPEAPSGSGRMWLYTGLAVLVVAGLGLVFFLNSQKPITSTDPVDVGPTRPKLPEDDETGPKKPPVAPAEVKLSKQEIQDRSLNELRTAGDYAEGPRARSYATRLLAESLMESGKPAEAKQELSNLSANARYLAIPILLMEAWPKLAAGDAAGAKTALDEAVAASAALPKEGRDRIDIASALAAALVAAGRVPEAQALAKDTAAIGQLSTLWRAAIDSDRFDFETLARRSCLIDMPQPQWVTVTQSLASHGRWDEAQQWALAGPGVAVRDNCVAALAAQLVASGLPAAEVQPRLDALAAAVDGAGPARVWAAVGQARLEQGDQAGATDAAAKAAAVLDALPLPAAVPLPPMTDLYRLASEPTQGLPDAAPLQSAALAAIDLAELQTRLGTKDQTARFEQGLKFLGGVAPNVAQTTKLTADNQGGRAAGMRQQLAQALGITETQAFAAASTYNNQCEAWHARATERESLERRLLERAARGGHLETAWKLAQAKQSASDPAEHQPLLKTAAGATPLAGTLYELAVTAKSPIRTEMETLLKPIRPAPSEVDRALSAIADLATAADWNAAPLAALKRYYGLPTADRHLVDLALLAAVLEHRASRPPEKIIAFLAQLPDTLIREDALWLLTARLTREGKSSKLLTDFNSRGYAVPDRLAIYRGFVDGSTAMPPESPAER
jgi:hypothetical protein